MANTNNFSHDNLDDFNESLPVNEFNANCLRILQWNIRGMNDLSKFDEILSVLEHCRSPIDVIVVGETWVKADNKSLYNIPGYNSFFSCRDNSNGGLAMYIRNGISYTVLRNIHVDGFHHINVELVFRGRNYNIHGFYRPPSYDINIFLNTLENILDSVNNCHSCFLVGDVNIPLNYKNNNIVRKYKSLLDSFGFACLNTFPTRPISQNILDHVICKVDDFVRSRNDTIYTDVSDHCILILSINLHAEKEKMVLTKTVVDHRQLDIEFKNFLSRFGTVQDVDLCFADITSTYNSLVTKHSRIVRKQINTKGKFCPWMSLNLWTLIRIKNNYMKRVKRNPNDLHLQDLLRHVSNKVVKLKKSTKKSYYDNLLNNTSNARMWKNINHIFGKSSKTESITLVENGIKITNNQAICEIFNKFFSSIGKKLADDIHCDPSANPCSNLQRVSDSIFLAPASANEVTLLINNLARNKGCGVDNISADIVKNNSVVFSRILSEAFNKMVEIGYYPDCLKIARVVPIFKSGDTCDPSNYRPISTLSVFNKILEKLLLNRIIPFLDKHNVLYSLQYGFRQGSSTSTAIVELLDDVISGIDTKQVVGALFLDLRKAFDTLNHSILLKKLECYGIRGVANDIIRSYLSERKQLVSIATCKSSLKPICVGVPQGSNIGPLLFLLYVNDLYRLQLKGTPRLFADDTALFYPQSDVDRIVCSMNNDLKTLAKFFEVNLLSLNISKTKCMFFHSHRKSVPQHELVVLNSCIIEEVKSYKYLGLILDPTLRWIDHIKYVENKVSSLCGVMRRVSYFVSRNTLLKFYYAHIHSCLSYLIIAWGRACKSSLRKLQTLQNRCLKTIFKKPVLYPTLQLYSDNSHNIIPVNGLCDLQTITFVHDTLHNHSFHHSVQLPSTNHSYSTRNSNHLRLLRAHTMFGHNRISIIGPKKYNALPVELKQIHNRSLFKFELKKFLKLNLHDILG